MRDALCGLVTNNYVDVVVIIVGLPVDEDVKCDVLKAFTMATSFTPHRISKCSDSGARASAGCPKYNEMVVAGQSATFGWTQCPVPPILIQFMPTCGLFYALVQLGVR